MKHARKIWGVLNTRVENLGVLKHKTKNVQVQARGRVACILRKTFAQLCTMQLKCTLQEAKHKARHDDIVMDSTDSGDDTDDDDEPRTKMSRRQ